MTPKFIFTCILVFSVSLNIFSQRMDGAGGGNSSIGISYTGVPVQSFKDTSGGFGYHALGLNISLPLFSNRDKIVDNMQKDGKMHFYQVSGRAAFDAFHSTIGFLKDQRNFYAASAGLGGIFSSGKKSFISTEATIGIAADDEVIKGNDLKYRFAGSFIVNNRHSATVMYQYGIVFTYAFGRPLPLPVLGIRKKFSKTWTFSAILPAVIQFTDRLNKQMSVSFLIRPVGNRFQLQNKNDFYNSPSSTVYLQLRQFELGASWQYRFAKQFSLSADAGFLSGGKIKITEPEDIKTIVYSANTKAGVRFRVSLRYHLPHKKTGANALDDEMLRLN